MKRLAILTNMVPPYRAPIFERLAERFDTIVLLSGHEDNRYWESATASKLRMKSVSGFIWKMNMRGHEGRVAEERYLHIHPGYAWDLLKFRPDAIISAEMGTRSAIAVLYGLVFRKPVWILWLGGIRTNEIRGKSILRRAGRRFFFSRLVRHWWSFGETSTEYLLRLGVPRERIVQTQNPVRESLFASDGSKYPLESPQPRVLFVGRLIENKGIYQLLATAADLYREGHQFSLVVVGNGPERARFEEKAKQTGFTGMELIQWVPPEEMSSVYRACDFLIFPTLDDVWGLVVNEALLSGLPVAASIYAGCATELLPAENVFDPLDSASFKEVFLRGLANELAPPGATRLQSAHEVADTIAGAIDSRIGRADR